VEAVDPKAIEAVGQLPIITICLLVIFGQFVLMVLHLMEVRAELKKVGASLAKVLLRFEDWLRKHGG
jgi:uncharacterized membrane protein YdfJ with MMPL/SSD domain